MGCTVSATDAVTDADVAETVVVPAVSPITTPALLTAATVGTVDVQLTAVVMSLVLPLLNFPVALNCVAEPTTSDGLAGLIVSEARDTTTASVPETEPDVARIAAIPGP
jgi:hypothetical protein